MPRYTPPGLCGLPAPGRPGRSPASRRRSWVVLASVSQDGSYGRLPETSGRKLLTKIVKSGPATPLSRRGCASPLVTMSSGEEVRDMRGFGELEAAIMDRLWVRGEPATVREVLTDLRQRPRGVRRADDGRSPRRQRRPGPGPLTLRRPDDHGRRGSAAQRAQRLRT